MRRATLSPRWYVRLARQAGAWAVLVLPSCGYRPAADVTGAEALCVRTTTTRVADPAAAAAAESGARQALARAGHLGECGRDRQLVVELVGLEDAPEGIARSEAGPEARGERVVVAVRGTLLSADGHTRERDLGVMTIGSTYAYAASSPGELEVRAAARSEAAWRAGRSMAERAMGQPSPSDPRPLQHVEP